MSARDDFDDPVDPELLDALDTFRSDASHAIDMDETLRLVKAGRRLVQELSSRSERVDELAHELEEQDRARTIVLSYTPRDYSDGPKPPHHDIGGYWTVSDGGRHQWGLDSREALALVASMLLGAPHPPLTTCLEHERRGEHRAAANTKMPKGERTT